MQTGAPVTCSQQTERAHSSISSKHRRRRSIYEGATGMPRCPLCVTSAPLSLHLLVTVERSRAVKNWTRAAPAVSFYRSLACLLPAFPGSDPFAAVDPRPLLGLRVSSRGRVPLLFALNDYARSGRQTVRPAVAPVSPSSLGPVHTRSYCFRVIARGLSAALRPAPGRC